MNKVLKVKCPTCETSFLYYDSEFRPFCSERCKMVDLGHWFEETYKVPLKENVFQDENAISEEESFEESNNQEDDSEYN